MSDASTVVAEIFVLANILYSMQGPRTFVRYTFSYSKDGVTYIGIRVWFSYATKCRTLRQKYKINKIKLSAKIYVISVYLQVRSHITG